ncbi:MAG: DEAD/DEAH box helicase [Candidatus Kerfeldbacteria bacterium]|nr:DEAD/DEAH box helicase [Candidatus Kerfeldbacteria bacterium]
MSTRHKSLHETAIPSFPPLERVQGVLDVQGLEHPSAKVCVLESRLPSLTKKREVLWFTNSDLETLEVADLLARFGIEARTYLFHSSTIAMPLLVNELLEKQSGLAVLSIEFLAEPFPTPEHFRASRRRFSEGETATPHDIAEFLEKAEYSHEDQAVLPGTYAVRGGIIDIFPEGHEKPYRIELNDSAIERITTFEPATKKVGATRATLTILPHESPKRESSFAEYYDRAAPFVVFSEPDRLRFEHPESTRVLESIESVNGVVFTFLAPYENASQTVTIVSSTPLPFDVQPVRIRKTLSAYLKKGFDITIHTSEPEKIKGLVSSLKNIRVIHRTLASHATFRGAVLPSLQKVWIEDIEIFGPPKRERRAKKDQEFLSELKTGDHIVHLDHGIGRFAGMTRRVADGIEREYYILEYAPPASSPDHPDRLFLPVEMSEKISKYIGSSEPKLNRLSGEHWFAVTRKVRQDTLQLAKELLDVSAKRHEVSIEAFGHEKAEEHALARAFPFEETEDQKHAIDEVMRDLEKSEPMDRVIAGDTGFGKTEVAIRAAFKAVMNGMQVVVLCPTTILAQQHADTFTDRLDGFPVRIGQLSRFQSPKQQDETIQAVKDGEIDIVIGTHRLLSDDVKLKKLGLVIVDEEQRFGVKDKEKLKHLRADAHVLTLTATPIPRTLNQTLSGLRDMSMISTPPLGRLSSETIVKPFNEKIITQAVTHELERKGQVYYVWNRVETIESKAGELKHLFPKARIGIAHGQLPEDELAHIMHEFDEGGIDILVTSTIIENGLDIPNANTLIVEHATIFGLADLYQLKGRIGRSDRSSFAYFLYASEKLTAEAKKRLHALIEARELGSGFRLAMRDLEIRGAGDLLGKRQHGHVTAIGLNLYTRLLEQAVTELRTGKPIPPFRDIVVDVPQTNSIPRSIEPHEGRRLRLYMEFANITKLAELRERRKEMEERGLLPTELKNLFDVFELKILAQPSVIIAVDSVRRNDTYHLYIKGYTTFEAGRITRLLAEQPFWDWNKEILKADVAALGKPWMPTLKKAVRLLCNGIEE